MAQDAERGARAATPDNRRENRDPIKLDARLQVSNGGRFQVGVLDLSATGFRIETANSIPRGRLVYLTMPGVEPLQARIVWNNHDFYGCEFTRPLHGSVFRHLTGLFSKARLGG